MKYGCFGCVGVVAIGILVAAVMGALVVRELSRERAQTVSQSEHSLPAVELPAPPEDEPGSRAAIFPLLDVDVAEPGRVILDLSHGSFVVEPGPEGQPIRLEADYDKVGFELVENYETHGETGWTYEVEFRKKGLFGIVVNTGEIPSVRVIIPRGVPFVLEAELGTGESSVELGGLWLLDADIEASLGEHRISFDEPLLAPMNRFVLEGSAGELTVEGLGNGSPRSATVEYSMGELTLDLDGPWARDAEIRAKNSMGALRVGFPDDVAVDLDSEGVWLGEQSGRGVPDLPDPRPGEPTLHVTVSVSMGILVVDQ